MSDNELHIIGWYLAAATLFASGTYLLSGLGWALIVLGVMALVIVVGLSLPDKAEKDSAS